MGGKRGAFEREHAGARKGVCVCQRAHLYLQLGLAQPAWCCGIALRIATRGGQDAHARCHKFSMHDGHIKGTHLAWGRREVGRDSAAVPSCRGRGGDGGQRCGGVARGKDQFTGRVVMKATRHIGAASLIPARGERDDVTVLNVTQALCFCFDRRLLTCRPSLSLVPAITSAFSCVLLQASSSTNAKDYIYCYSLHCSVLLRTRAHHRALGHPPQVFHA